MTYTTTSTDVIDCFGDRLICDRCGATVSTYGDRCSAALDVHCPGFEAYDDLLRLTAQTVRRRRRG